MKPLKPKPRNQGASTEIAEQYARFVKALTPDAKFEKFWIRIRADLYSQCKHLLPKDVSVTHNADGTITLERKET